MNIIRRYQSRHSVRDITLPDSSMRLHDNLSSLLHSPKKIASLSAASMVAFLTPALVFANHSNEIVQPKSADTTSDVHNDTTQPLDKVAQPAQAQASSSFNINSEQHAQSTKKPTVNVRVNDQPIAVPENGTTHQTIATSDGNTAIDIHSQQSIDNDGTISNSSSSLEVNVTSEQQSGGDE